MDITYIIYVLLAILSIQSVGGLYIIYRLAILVKARTLYEAKEFMERPEGAVIEQTIDTEEDMFPGVGPLTSKQFADVTPTR